MDLPFDSSARRCWTVSFGKKGQSRVSLEVQLHRWGACARLFGPYPDPIGMPRRVLLWEVELRVRPPVAMRSSHQGAMQMWFDVPTRQGKRLQPVLQAGLRCAIRSLRFQAKWRMQAMKTASLLTGDEAVARIVARGKVDPVELERRRASRAKRRDKERLVISTMRQAFRELQAHVFRRLVPRASRIADRFAVGSQVRPMVYRMVADDRTRRVAQMARICPGVLLMMAFLERTSPDAVAELLKMIVSGARLPKIIDRVVESWERTLPSPQPEEIRGNQRIRIRRATAGIIPDHLWEPHIGKLVPEDIPRGARGNRAWFLVTSAARKALEELPPDERPDGLLTWASCYSSDLCAIWGNTLDTLTWRFRWLCDYLVWEERTPGRKTLPQDLIEDCTIWHGSAWNGAGLPLHEKMNPGPTAGFPLWETRYGFVRFLDTAGDIYEEGKWMRHCVGSHAERARKGSVQVFHGEFEGERATIEISCSKGYPCLIDARGFANSSLSSTAMRGIGNWLADLGKHVSGF